MALIIEGSILLIIGFLMLMIGNGTIDIKNQHNEHILQYAPVGSALSFIVGLFLIARGIFL